MNKSHWLCIGMLLITSYVALAQTPARLGTAARFSSAYSDLKQCGSGMTPQQEKELAKQGQDIPARCKGMGGYTISLFSGGAHTQFQLERGSADETPSPSRRRRSPHTESLWVELLYVGDKIWDRRIEWRMANGKPFALIFRREIWEDGDKGWKKRGEEILVKGLAGYEDLDEVIHIRKTPNPNLAARQVADTFYQTKK